MQATANVFLCFGPGRPMWGGGPSLTHSNPTAKRKNLWQFVTHINARSETEKNADFSQPQHSSYDAFLINNIWLSVASRQSTCTPVIRLSHYK